MLQDFLALIYPRNCVAFGAPMPGRNYQPATPYRMGFNGKENDREVTSTGSGTQDYGMRIYNPSLGKFLSIDPLTKDYPWYTPYQFAGNKPIVAIDLDGEEESIRIISTLKGQTHITTIPWNKLYPGQEHGSKGTGTLDYTKDEKTGKWDKGRYVKSFADVHPVKAFFGSEYNDRYTENKGLRNLGKDLSSSSTYVKVTGVVVIGIGGLTLQPEIVAGGVAIYELGGTMDNIGTGAEVLSDFNDGKTKDATIKIAGAITGKVVGDAIGGSANSEAQKVVGKILADEAIDAIKEQPEQQPKKAEGEAKKLNKDDL